MSVEKQKEAIEYTLKVINLRIERLLYLKNSRGILEASEQYDLERCLAFCEMGEKLLKPPTEAE